MSGLVWELFLAFQYPVTIHGVRWLTSCGMRSPTFATGPQGGGELMPMKEFRQELRQTMTELNIDQEFARRYLNDGFSA